MQMLFHGQKCGSYDCLHIFVLVSSVTINKSKARHAIHAICYVISFKKIKVTLCLSFQTFNQVS